MALPGIVVHPFSSSQSLFFKVPFDVTEKELHMSKEDTSFILKNLFKSFNLRPNKQCSFSLFECLHKASLMSLWDVTIVIPCLNVYSLLSFFFVCVWGGGVRACVRARARARVCVCVCVCVLGVVLFCWFVLLVCFLFVVCLFVCLLCRVTTCLVVAMTKASSAKTVETH